MPETAQESDLQSRTLLTAQVVRAYTLVREIWDYYAPPTWLLLYYPLLYLAKVAKRLSVPHPGREIDTRLDVKLAPIRGKGLSWVLTHVGLETATATMSAAILGPLLYVLLLRCGFLESDFWKGTLSAEAEMDDPRSSGHEVPDRLLHTSVDIGLDEHEVIARRKAYGTNELRPPRRWISVVVRLLIGPANLPLETAAFLAILCHDWWDLLLVCGLLALNIRGAVQQIRQHDEIAQSLAWDPLNLATTLREGKIFETTVRELVPGDIVRVSEGSGIPAEARVAKMDSTLYMDQSNLTGDSDHVKKYHGDICYTGSSVVRGDGCSPLSELSGSTVG